MPTIKEGLLFKVLTGASYSPTHRRFYYGGSHDYFADGRSQEYYSMSTACAVCEDSIYDGDPICGPAYDREDWRVIHINCCTDASHEHAVRPEGVPPDAQLIELPYSEVCMHMRVAGTKMWVAPVGERMAQLYDADGRKFSMPITRGEAGLR